MIERGTESTGFLMAVRMIRLSLCAPVIAFGLCFHAHAADNVIKPGQNIDDISKWLIAAEYKETDLQMRASLPEDDLRFWAVDQGYLIVTFSTKSKKASHMSYVLNYEGPKGSRRPISLQITEFTPLTGEMKIKLPKKRK